MNTVLTPEQIKDLAKPLVEMIQAMTDFYKDPKKEKEYQEWHKKKYGSQPLKGQAV